MPTKDDPRRWLFPGFTGRVMVDTFRGKVRVRKWPEKRGRPKSAAVRAQNDWFRDANRLAVRAPGPQLSQAITITRNSGLYPRDLLIRMMAGNMGPIPLNDGRTLTKARKRIDPVSFQGATLQLLTPFDLLADTLTAVVWPLPLIDNAGLWSAGAPSLLTITPNVTRVRVTASLVSVGANIHDLTGAIRHNGVNLTLSRNTALNANTVVMPSGVIPVTPGDTFDVTALTSLASSLFASTLTSLSLEIMEAT